ncbi:MAG: AraC family transcriptional regulator [Ruminococcaceae bacterium]|nr:AraC family transcriptional regulator [Oscillospiraceae bacterium]
MIWKAFVTKKIGEINIRITHTRRITSEENRNAPIIEPHIHNECEIYINLRGDVSFAVENNIYPIERGSVIITKPFEYHYGIHHSNGIDEYYWITFTADENEDFMDIFYNRNKGENNLFKLDEEKLSKVIDILEDILYNPIDSLKRQIMILTFFSILRESVPMCADATAKTVPPDILNALTFMDDHLTENITVKDIASHVNQSINTLERRFKKTLGVSPTKMLVRKRLLLSQDFLKNGDSVTDAAIKCGIHDYSNYIQLFKKQFKMTPLHFKRQYKDYLTDANNEIRNY